ncbi:MAG: type II toxin-antitoxin system VapC family toxin [bacterium]|nr:type II toxin-antitoxin system VapC family toxin [bacterium]
MNENGDIYFIDTNILVYATLEDFDEKKHKLSKGALEKKYEQGAQYYISTQILRELYAIITNNKYLSNPLSPETAKDVISYYQSEFNLLLITKDVISRLLEIVSGKNIKGQKIHDATIAATMIEHDINNIITFNDKDFRKFTELNAIVPG